MTPLCPRLLFAPLVAACLGGATLTGRAQVTVTVLGTGANNSVAYAVAGGQQAGFDGVAPTIWSGSPSSAGSLLPAGAFVAHVRATDGVRQGGFADFTNVNGTEHAALWTGSAASFVDLHPGGADWSRVQALSGAQQAGVVNVGGVSHATLWSGTAASALDLNPAGAAGSGLLTMSATQQAGYASVGGVSHAGLWSGSAASFVDLHPAGAAYSAVYGLNGNTQGGQVGIGANSHAALWTGSAASFLDLNPAGASDSAIFAVAGGYQAGAATFSGHEHGGWWDGTATFYDVQAAVTAALGANFTDSVIHGADLVGNTLYLVGEAFDPGTSDQRAILVALAVPEPAASAWWIGVVVLGAVWLVARRRKTISR